MIKRLAEKFAGLAWWLWLVLRPVDFYLKEPRVNQPYLATEIFTLFYQISLLGV